MGRDKSLGSLLLVLFVFCIAGSQAGQYCYKYNRYYYTTSATYCTYGCCGSSGNQYCCDSDVGLIVGGVVAGILCVSILVALMCCCIKKQSHAGRMIHPTVPASRPGANVTVIYTGASSEYPGAYPMGTALPMPAAQPPAYKPYAPPPAYNYSDPVYPPTAPPANLGASIYPPRVPSAPSSPVPPTGLNSSGSVAPPNTSLRQ